MLHYYEDEEISGLQDLLMHFLVSGFLHATGKDEELSATQGHGHGQVFF